MIQVRCLRCASLVDERAPSYPVCPVCEENLEACLHCAHFDSESEECLHPQGSELHPRGRESCQEHASRIRAAGRSFSLHPALRVLLLAGPLFTLLYVSSRAVAPSLERLPQLRLAVTSPYREVRAGTPVFLWFEVKNQSRSPSGPVHLRLSGAGLAEELWPVARLQPRPEEARIRKGEWRLVYPGLPGDGDHLILMKLVTTRPGTDQLKVKLFLRARDLQGQVIIPLRVLPAAASPRP